MEWLEAQLPRKSKMDCVGWFFKKCCACSDDVSFALPIETTDYSLIPGTEDSVDNTVFDAPLPWETNKNEIPIPGLTPPQFLTAKYHEQQRSFRPEPITPTSSHRPPKQTRHAATLLQHMTVSPSGAFQAAVPSYAGSERISEHFPHVQRFQSTVAHVRSSAKPQPPRVSIVSAASRWPGPNGPLISSNTSVFDLPPLLAQCASPASLAVPFGQTSRLAFPPSPANGSTAPSIHSGFSASPCDTLISTRSSMGSSLPAGLPPARCGSHALPPGRPAWSWTPPQFDCPQLASKERPSSYIPPSSCADVYVDPDVAMSAETHTKDDRTPRMLREKFPQPRFLGDAKVDSARGYKAITAAPGGKENEPIFVSKAVWAARV